MSALKGKSLLQFLRENFGDYSSKMESAERV